MGLRICPSWRPTFYSLSIQFDRMALQSRQKALFVGVLGALTVFSKAPAVRLLKLVLVLNLSRNNKQAFSTGAQEIDKGRGGDSTDLRQPIGKSSRKMKSNQESRKA